MFCTLGVITYYNLFYFFPIIQRLKPSKILAEYPGVSIIICGRNEAKNISEIIEPIVNQNYSNFEILLVDDHSSDGSFELMQDLATKYASKIKVLGLKTDKQKFPGKKYALQQGILNCKHEIVLLTDADCKPSSDQWVKHMVEALDNKDIVLGYGPFYKEAGIWNKVFSYENIYTAVKYFSFAQKKIPYMGVGRNLLYRKSLFLANDGFNSHMEIASGDDDLFISEVATSENVSICIHPDAYMFSPAAKGLKHYVNQKVRHLSTSVNYKRKLQVLLGLEGGVHYLFHILLLFLCIFDNNIIALLYIYIFKCAIQMIGFSPFCKHIKNVGLIPFITVLDLLYLEIYLYISLKLFFKRTITWR